jgi:hypothetical protein
MSDLYIHGVPGVRAEITATHRRVFKQAARIDLAQGRYIDGTKARDTGNTGDLDCLRAGVLLGKITASGKFANSSLGVTTNAEAAGSTSIEAAAAVITELVRRVGASGTFKLIGPPTANGAANVETVTYSAASGTTITATAITNAFVAGSLIAPTDGSEFPLTFVPDGFPMKVTDPSGTGLDRQFPDMPIGGVVESAQLLPWPSDTGTRAWIVGQLNQQAGGQFVFDHLYS